MDIYTEMKRVGIQSLCDFTILRIRHMSFHDQSDNAPPDLAKNCVFVNRTIVPDDTLDNSAAGIDFPESVAVTVQAPRLLVHPYGLWPLPTGHQR